MNTQNLINGEESSPPAIPLGIRARHNPWLRGLLMFVVGTVGVFAALWIAIAYFTPPKSPAKPTEAEIAAREAAAKRADEARSQAMDLLAQMIRDGDIGPIDYHGGIIYCDVGHKWNNTPFRERQTLCQLLLVAYPGHDLVIIRDFRDHSKLMSYP